VAAASSNAPAAMIFFMCVSPLTNRPFCRCQWAVKSCDGQAQSDVADIATMRQVARTQRGNSMRTFVTTAILFSLAAPVVAKERKAVDPNRKFCREQGTTGSLLAKQVCHTAAEWQAIDERARDNSRDFDNKRREGTSSTQGNF
jgi:hypothetical protein